MILLDTHALIWAAREPAKLSKPAAHAIRTAGESGGLAISAITTLGVGLAGDPRSSQLHWNSGRFCRKAHFTNCGPPDHPKNRGSSKSASRDIFKGLQRPADRGYCNGRRDRSGHQRQNDPKLQTDQNHLVRLRHPDCAKNKSPTPAKTAGMGHLQIQCRNRVCATRVLHYPAFNSSISVPFKRRESRTAFRRDHIRESAPTVQKRLAYRERGNTTCNVPPLSIALADTGSTSKGISTIRITLVSSRLVAVG